MRLQNRLLKFIFTRRGFLPPPEIPADPARDQVFEALWKQIKSGSGFAYHLDYPKSWFTRNGCFNLDEDKFYCFNIS